MVLKKECALPRHNLSTPHHRLLPLPPSKPWLHDTGIATPSIRSRSQWRHRQMRHRNSAPRESARKPKPSRSANASTRSSSSRRSSSRGGRMRYSYWCLVRVWAVRPLRWSPALPTNAVAHDVLAGKSTAIKSEYTIPSLNKYSNNAPGQ